MSLSGWAASLLWPHRCILCGGVVAYGEITCARCRRQIPPLRRAASCRGLPVAAVWRYQGPVPAAIGRFKFRGDRDTGRKLALLMARAWRKQCPGFGAQAVTFVPMPPERQRQRGFNQAELLARWVAEELALPAVSLLRREGVLMQHELSAGFRRKGIEESFSLLPGCGGSVAGRRLLLVDDITTTGGTTLACAQLLLAAGAEAVAILVAASGL